MGDEVRVIPVDLKNGKYVIEIPAECKDGLHDMLKTLDEWIDGGGPFLILYPGMKLIRIDTDDIQEKT